MSDPKLTGDDIREDLPQSGFGQTSPILSLKVNKRQGLAACIWVLWPTRSVSSGLRSILRPPTRQKRFSCYPGSKGSSCWRCKRVEATRRGSDFESAFRGKGLLGKRSRNDRTFHCRGDLQAVRLRWQRDRSTQAVATHREKDSQRSRARTSSSRFLSSDTITSGARKSTRPAVPSCHGRRWP